MKRAPLLFGLFAGLLIGWFANQSIEPSARQNGLTMRKASTGLRESSDKVEVNKPLSLRAASSGSLNFTQKKAYLENFDDQSSISEITRILELVGQMNTAELLAALEASEASGRTGSNHHFLLSFLFRALLERAPAEAENYYRALANHDMRQLFRQSLYHVKTEQDLAQSIEDLNNIKDYNERSEALGLIVRNLAKSQPMAALELLESREDAKANAYKQLFSIWASIDIDAAIAQLELLPVGPKRQQGWNGLIPTLVIKDPQLAVEYAQTHLSGRLQHDVIKSLIFSLARENINEAVEILDQLPYGNAYESAVHRIANEWGKKDTDAALAWARGLEEGSEKQLAIHNVLSSLANHNPEKAKSYYWSLNDLHHKKLLARTISQKIAENQPAEALQWLESLSEPEVVNFAYDELIAKRLHRDVNWVIEHLASTGDGDRLNRLAPDIVKQLSRLDFAAAAAWTNTLTDKETHAHTLRRLAFEWVSHDTYEASQWIASLEPGEARDGAINVLLYKLRNNDPVAAFAWATAVSDARERQKLTQRMIDTMQRSGQTNLAIHEINSSPLSIEEKAFLIKRLNLSTSD